jgi:hypothetical protein
MGAAGVVEPGVAQADQVRRDGGDAPDHAPLVGGGLFDALLGEALAVLDGVFEEVEQLRLAVVVKLGVQFRIAVDPRRQRQVDLRVLGAQGIVGR